MKLYKILVFLLLISFTACNNADFSPKPRGFYRISFPEKTYLSIKEDLPYSFEIPSYATLNIDSSEGTNRYWKNLDFPTFNATLHISYFPISSKANLNQLTEDARTFAFKHSAKASAIDQITINKTHKNVYGLTYLIKGNTASNLQFFLTDSTNKYLRAALYFNEKPNLDSIQPVLDFLRRDIDHIVDTFEWK
ncbi:gliding motility lipoprotein GldD [Sphingobacterium sp. UT-1RO-CII-1]|uniref:gliding motility lipoprotein GldD n=1 Tax=Sphingobacterium sp. UT-1RO-CII-1 TaxID=2995225 RepID=UPI00227D1A4F|nr:gliding motility lipoprotein GldD [Sphingobacterium sp. UT-1RO-CII-1]MCY4780937.1 gliding motility lipoprotein GldD [Sphingobacterium sp. UT-1RO-CII-1]